MWISVIATLHKAISSRMRKYALLAVGLILLTLAIAHASPSGRRLVYKVEVGECGNALVTVTFTASMPGNLSLYMPKFTRVDVVEVVGSFKWVKNESAGYWYNYCTFAYTPGSKGEFLVSFRYKFPYASLLIDDNAWFMTPLIGADDDVPVEVRVTLPDFKELTYSNVKPTLMEDGEFCFHLVRTSEGARVVITYKLTRTVESSSISKTVDGMEIVVEGSPCYTEFMNKVADVLVNCAPYLEEAFGELADKVEFKFFLPERMDIYTHGYVFGEDINFGGKGPIHLNLALIRFAPGYLETTVVHEYVHLALGRAGIEANTELRWFHEGVAQYVSMEACKRAGYDLSLIEEDYKEGVKELLAIRDENFGFLQRWRPMPGEQGLYYMASYYIFSYLAERYGGLSFVKKVVEISRERGGISTNAELIRVLSLAAGEDLTPLFKRWGFNVEEVGEIPLKDREVKIPPYLVIVAIVVVVVAVAIAIYGVATSVKRRREERRGYVRCPYCGAVVRADFAFCPYCGAPLRPITELGGYYGAY